MGRIVIKSKIGADGVLHLRVPIGLADACQEVQVTIDSLSAPASRSHEEWQAFLRATAGAWQGELERPPQGEYEQRDELP